MKPPIEHIDMAAAELNQLLERERALSDAKHESSQAVQILTVRKASPLIPSCQPKFAGASRAHVP